MADVHKELDAAIQEATRARAALKKGSKQVTSNEELGQLKAVAYAWFKSHKPQILLGGLLESDLAVIDAAYVRVLEATHKASARSTYLEALQVIRSALSVAVTTAATKAGIQVPTTSDDPPDFSTLAADPKMQEILIRRWHECQRCIGADAYLAATVMMGGLLEALCVARANKMKDKAPLFKQKSTPIEGKTGKPLQLAEWTLRPYLDVGHELGWLSKSAKDVGAVLRDYRNYIHPQKEYSHAVVLGPDDASMFWEVTKSLTRQILAS